MYFIYRWTKGPTCVFALGANLCVRPVGANLCVRPVGANLRVRPVGANLCVCPRDYDKRGNNYQIMLRFQYSSLINAPVETVWNFHERPDILKILTPPWQPVEVVRREGGLDVGAISEFKIFLGPIPVKWVARHTDCKRYQLFTDKQIEGPMESWVHQHQFVEENGKTRLTDTIEYSLPGGSWAEMILGWWVEARLKDMFRYRHEITKQECEQS